MLACKYTFAYILVSTPRDFFAGLKIKSLNKQFKLLDYCIYHLLIPYYISFDKTVLNIYTTLRFLTYELLAMSVRYNKALNYIFFLVLALCCIILTTSTPASKLTNNLELTYNTDSLDTPSTPITATNPEQTSEVTHRYLTENIIIADIGSTGTRLHAYNIQKPANVPKNAIPFITEIAIAKNGDKRAVADYYNNVKDLNGHIEPLYKDISSQLDKLNIDTKEVPIYLYATAGMRLQDQKHQNQIYQEVIKIIANLGHNKNIIQAKTITGELEGIFDWLSVNYKLKTIQNNETTVAALDMGGASTQVAIEYPAKYKINNKIQNLYKIKFANKEYNIFSKSILGYGLTQTKKKISDYDNKQAITHCSLRYGESSPPTQPQNQDHYSHELGNDLNEAISIRQNHAQNDMKDFNFNNCSKFIQTYLKSKKEHLGITKIIKKSIENNMKFIAASGYYYKFKLFNSKLPEDLIKSIPDSCHSHRAEFIKKFPNLSEQELNEACFDATYLKILLNNAYNIPEKYHNFSIPKHDIDWTVGAALFISTNQSI